ncbi:(2Fe-2S)-binding protein [Chloroflexota bacterium]|nr:(2Fe-2S)-binding protein [Chloroflexota bacterium]
MTQKAETRTYPISCTINGEIYNIEVESHKTLLWVLREQLNITGPKECCGIGECGACTVLMDGKSVNSCLVLAVEADGHEIVTIEGLGGQEKLDPIQQAFIDQGAVQCGFCTPGMIMSAKYLLDNNKNPSEEEIAVALSGNYCRCTGYKNIIDAVKAAALKYQE